MIVRTPERDRFVMIAKQSMEDSRLSWKARGLLAYLLTKPDNWNVMVCQLVKEAPDGRDAVYSGLAELERFGYITRTMTRSLDGSFDGVETQVHEIPIESDNPTSTENGLSVSGQSTTKEERSLKKTEDISTPSENPSSDAFDEFYGEYPLKLEKAAAKKAWAKAVKVANPETILAGVRRYRGDPNREKEFTKYPATWLNKGCWNDDPLPPRCKTNGRRVPMEDSYGNLIGYEP